MISSKPSLNDLSVNVSQMYFSANVEKYFSIVTLYQDNRTNSVPWCHYGEHFKNISKPISVWSNSKLLHLGPRYRKN